MKNEWIKTLQAKAQELQIDGESGKLTVSDVQAERLYRYMELLVEWNEKMNLTALTDPADIMSKHFLDSAAGMGFLPEGTIADIGTGAGFPGLVLKVMEPERPVVLMDALQKRLTFLQEVSRELGLSGVEFAHDRAEDAGQKPQYREQYDGVVSRAVAALPVLLEYCVPFIKVGGLFLAYKGPALKDELEQSKHALKVLGCSVESVHNITLPGEDWEHLIAVIRKEKPTHHIYPRRQAKIKKDPL